MTRALTADEIVHAMQAWEIPYVETPGWRTRGNGRAWVDPFGFMWHHTGDDAPDSADLRIVTYGHASLSGPLCNFGLADDGTVHLVAAGPANHAGGSDPAVVAAIKAQSYTTAPPAPRFAHGEAGSVVINTGVYGVESFYYAKDSPDQFAMMSRLAAAIIWAMNKANGTSWNAKRAFGHKESQRGKIDPRTFAGNTMKTLRDTTQVHLDAGPAGSNGDDMSADDVQKINDYTFDILFDGFTKDGQAFPGLFKVMAETQRRVTEAASRQLAFEVATKTKIDGLLALVAKQAGLTQADVDKISVAAEAGARAGIQSALAADVKVDVTLAQKEVS